MNKFGRTLSAAATTIGIALVAAGCGNTVIGADGPQPGLAAEVEGTEITLDDLTSAVDGLCTLQAADEAASTTSRAFAQSEILKAWVTSLIDAEFAAERDLDVAPDDPGLELAAGWDDVDEDDREALRAYVDAFLFSAAVQELSTDEAPDPADYDITINPRFDIELQGNDFEPAGYQLSVPVSKEAALETEAPTLETLQTLSEDELCGKPVEADAAPPVPLG